MAHGIASCRIGQRYPQPKKHEAELPLTPKPPCGTRDCVMPYRSKIPAAGKAGGRVGFNYRVQRILSTCDRVQAPGAFQHGTVLYVGSPDCVVPDRFWVLFVKLHLSSLLNCVGAIIKKKNLPRCPRCLWPCDLNKHPRELWFCMSAWWHLSTQSKYKIVFK
jgi:hypothetical protein